MKKIFASIFFVFCSLFILVSCGKKGNGGYTGKPIGVNFHYQRADNDYSEFNSMWVWSESHPDGTQVYFDKKDDYGKYLTIKLADYNNDTAISFIVRSDDWAKDVDKDRTADLTLFKVNSKGYYDVYLKSGDENIYTSASGSTVAAIKSFAVKYANNEYVLEFVLSTGYTTFSITKNGEALVSSDTLSSDSHVGEHSETKVVYSLGDEMPSFSDAYVLKANFPDGSELEEAANMSALYDTDAFVENYTYTGELGAIYTESATTFRVWSPVSTSVKLRVYDNGTPKSVNATTGNDDHTDYEMTSGEKGTWEYTLTGDQQGKYYTYVVTNYKWQNKEVVDPYAYSTGINGIRGMVVDFSKTNPEGWDNVSVLELDPTQLTVYETHIADLTSSDTWGGTAANAKLFKGFYEAGTTYTKDNVTVKTGFDHIKELGVNAVQIIPIFDAQNNETEPEFNWGYNPLNYNSLDGIYSSNPYDGYEKIKEFKNLVKAYNEAGINIIMDVVYNHVSGAEGSQFDAIMPGYYYRYNGTALSNGSGCGNETASDRAMFQKFMIDSTEFWATEYKLGGFRFDLMGLHDLDTMNKLSKNLHDNVSEYITVYGEPWTGGDSPLSAAKSAKQINIGSYGEYGCFNDKMRDGLIKGGLNSADKKGWITATNYTEVKNASGKWNNSKDQFYFKDENGNYVKVTDDIANNPNTKFVDGKYANGITYYEVKPTSTSDTDKDDIIRGISGIVLLTADNDPSQCVNYVTCHDNYTLYDRIVATGTTDEATIEAMAMLANSVVFTSQGISFMLAGEEFLRTKQGNSNSYNASYEVNELNYALKVDHLDMFAKYQKLIALKKSGTVFSLNQTACKDLSRRIATSEDKGMFSYKITSTDNKEYYIVHANGIMATDANRTLDLTGYTVYLDTVGTYAEGHTFTGEVVVSEYQTIIAYKTL